MIVDKVNLLDYTLAELEEYFACIGEKSFRARQVFRWIHVFGIVDFENMTDIAKSLRSKLTELTEIRMPTLENEHKTADGVIKWALKVDEHNTIETVFIPEDDRGTLCISSQVGCALECTFCATGRQGFNRNLTSGEIIGQLWWALRRLINNNKSAKPITNVVMMGMGEPLANYTNVVRAMKVMLDDNAYNLSRKKLTLSTSGMVPWLDRLKEDCPVALAVSLHASNDKIRDEIVPLNKKYPIHELLMACNRYLAKSPKDYVTFEYVMLKGVNDDLAHAEELAKLVAKADVSCKFNLIPFNPFTDSGFESSSAEQIIRFQKVLKSHGYITTIRKTRGVDIAAACGQLAGLVFDKTKRQQKWRTISLKAI